MARNAIKGNTTTMTTLPSQPANKRTNDWYRINLTHLDSVLPDGGVGVEEARGEVGEDLGVEGGRVDVCGQVARLLEETKACGSVAGGEEPNHTGKDLLLVLCFPQQLANLGRREER
ncbi:hypothetical protein E2C01_008543 [Portunus trituberculatus]|uniref:Uncharacterized protein n=1 Tax=Portunus trituberculatus TaxID=210409 RepID=A0A5B7D5I0_PORTR|nr:hypothetical protein [Portunus trituberculatus]